MAFQIEPLHRCIDGSITHSERRSHFKKIWSSSPRMRVLQVFHGLARWHGLAGKINEVGAGSFRPQCRPCKSSRSWTLSSLSRLVSQVRQQTHECDEFQRKGTISQEMLNRSLAASSRAEDLVIAQDIDF